MKLKVGDIVQGVYGWESFGQGIILKAEQPGCYKVLFFKSNKTFTPVVEAGLKFIRKQSKLDKVLK